MSINLSELHMPIIALPYVAWYLGEPRSEEERRENMRSFGFPSFEGLIISAAEVFLGERPALPGRRVRMLGKDLPDIIFPRETVARLFHTFQHVFQPPFAHEPFQFMMTHDGYLLSTDPCQHRYQMRSLPPQAKEPLVRSLWSPQTELNENNPWRATRASMHLHYLLQGDYRHNFDRLIKHADLYTAAARSRSLQEWNVLVTENHRELKDPLFVTTTKYRSELAPTCMVSSPFEPSSRYLLCTGRTDGTWGEHSIKFGIAPANARAHVGQDHLQIQQSMLASITMGRRSTPSECRYDFTWNLFSREHAWITAFLAIEIFLRDPARSKVLMFQPPRMRLNLETQELQSSLLRTLGFVSSSKHPSPYLEEDHLREERLLTPVAPHAIPQGKSLSYQQLFSDHSMTSSVRGFRGVLVPLEGCNPDVVSLACSSYISVDVIVRAAYASLFEQALYWQRVQDLSDSITGAFKAIYLETPSAPTYSFPEGLIELISHYAIHKLDVEGSGFLVPDWLRTPPAPSRSTSSSSSSNSRSAPAVRRQPTSFTQRLWERVSNWFPFDYHRSG